MTKTLKIKYCTFLRVAVDWQFLSIYHQLGDFAHLKNVDGVLTDSAPCLMRCCGIFVFRIGLALLTGASLAIAGNAMQGIFQNPLASPGLLGSSSGATAASVYLSLVLFCRAISLLLAGEW